MTETVLPDRVWWPVAIEATESLLGHSARTMQDNVLPHLAAVLREAGQVHRNRAVDIVRGEADPMAIAAVLGLDPGEVERRRGRDLGYGRVEFCGLVMRAGDVVTRVRRFSPSSLAKKPFHRNAWMLRHLPFCEESWEPLISRCACEAVQTWTMVRDVTLCEDCGRPLSETRVGRIPEAEQPMLRLYAALLSADPKRRDAARAAMPSSLAHLRPDELVELALCIVSAAGSEISGSPRRPAVWNERPMTFASEIARAMTVLLGWPRSLANGLGGTMEARKAEPRQKAMIRISRMLADRQRPDVPTATAKVLDAAADAIASPGRGDLVSIDFAEAERTLGRLRSTLRRGRRAGQLSTTFILRRGELLPALDRSEVETLAGIRSIGAAVLGGRVAIPRYAVQQMAASGLLSWVDHPFVIAEDGLRIELGCWEDLASRLVGRSVHIGAEGITLSRVLRSIGGCEKPYAAVYAGLAEGRWQCEVRGRVARPADIVVLRGEVAEIRAAASPAAALSAPFADPYVQEDARDVLNLHHRYAARIKSLEHAKTRTARLYDRAAILALARRHVTIGEIMAWTGLMPKTIATRLTGAGLINGTGFGFDRVPARKLFVLEA